MIDAALLCSVASQLMTQPEVNIQGRKLRVSHTSLHHFRTIDTQGRERNHRKPGAFCNIKESDRESPKGNTLLQLFQAGVRAETPGDIFLSERLTSTAIVYVSRFTACGRALSILLSATGGAEALTLMRFSMPLIPVRLRMASSAHTCSCL